MKRMLLFMVVMLFSGLVMAQDWQVVREGNVEYLPNDGFFISADSGWYVGSGGVVVRTVDGGESGETIREPMEGAASWKAVEFANNMVGYACAEDGFVYKTVDAGLTWDMVGDTTLNQNDLLKISVVDQDTVLVSGKKSTFMKTYDGGQTWSISAYDFGQDLDAGIGFCNSRVGVVATDKKGAYSWYTHDGGESWNPVTITFPPGATYAYLKAVEAVGDSTIILSGWHHTIFISTDGGQTYAHSGEITSEFDSYSTIDALDENTFFIAGQDGHIVTTVNGGAAWNSIDIPSGEDVVFVDFIDVNTGYAFAKYAQWFKTEDGGLNWTPIVDWPNVNFHNIGFVSNSQIYFTGWNGQLSISEDGGYTFSYPLNTLLQTDSHLEAVEFIDQQNGLIGGGGGKLFRTTDGGTTWTMLDTTANPMYKAGKTIYVIHYVDANMVFAAGSGGVIMKSNDGGLTWTSIYNEENNAINDLWVVSSKQVVAVASGGEYYVSNAAVDSFFMPVDYGSMKLRSVEFRGDVGLVIAEDGNVFRTTVANWDTLILAYEEPNKTDFTSAVFLTDSLVYAVGYGGAIFRSEDAGLTWVEESSPTEEILWRVKYNNNKLWAVGNDGVVLMKDFTPPAPLTGLVINEFMASNDAAFADEYGDYDDWIEIYNMNDHPVDLGGLFVTDDLDDPTLWQIPTSAPDSTTIPAGGFLVLWADKESEEGILHLELKLSGSGEQVGLVEDFMGDTLFIDSLTYGPQWADTSYGYVQDGGGDRAYFQPATPGTTNGDGIIVVGIEEDSNPVIAEYHLSQNYPNPFNPLTSIEFSIKQAGKTTLIVYSVTGQKVKTLLNKDMGVGTAKVSFDASRLASGVYFYELKSGKFSSVKKMLLMK